MDPAIWKKFPPELIIMVINQTSGSTALKNWCAATCTDDSLLYYHQAIRRYHQRFVLSRRNLVSQNTVSTRRTLATVQVDTGEIPRAVQLPSTSDLLPRPATYIKSLVLNFQSGYNKGSILDFKKIDYSLELLLQIQRLGHLRVIEQYGDLHPNHFIRFLATRGLEKLTVRKLNAHAPPRLLGRYGRYDDYPDLDLQLPFELLRRRNTMTSLEAGNIMSTEVAGLAVAVRTLENLEILHVTAASEDGIAPMSRFLEAMFRKCPRLPYGFPASLRSLTLIDAGYG